MTQNWDITSYVTAAGEIDVNFWCTSGTDGLWVYWAALLENGVELDRDTHTGFTGASQTIPIYVLRLAARKPGATYTIRASVAGRGGTDSYGSVSLPNWD